MNQIQQTRTLSGVEVSSHMLPLITWEVVSTPLNDRAMLQRLPASRHSRLNMAVAGMRVRHDGTEKILLNEHECIH